MIPWTSFGPPPILTGEAWLDPRITQFVILFIYQNLIRPGSVMAQPITPGSACWCQARPGSELITLRLWRKITNTVCSQQTGIEANSYYKSLFPSYSSTYMTLILILSDCSLVVLWLFSECSLKALWVLSESSLSALWLFSDCSLSALWVLWLLSNLERSGLTALDNLETEGWTKTHYCFLISCQTQKRIIALWLLSVCTLIALCLRWRLTAFKTSLNRLNTQ